MGYIYARLIHKGQKKITDVPQKYVNVTRDAYYELFGEDI